MPGVAGFWTRGPLDATARSLVRGMADAMTRRDPAREGAWTDTDSGVALAGGGLSADSALRRSERTAIGWRRYIVVCDGEIHNYRQLQRELPTQPRSQDEVLGPSHANVALAAIEAWGLHAAVLRFVGAFSFAIWDRKHRALHLVRDPLGIKPLY